jgi:hypothetical protein
MQTLLSTSRRLVAFSAAALLLAACVAATTNPPGAAGAAGLPSGFMRVTLSLAAPANFTKYNYEIVFNATGNGRTPTAPNNAGGTGNLATYSYTLTVSGGAGGTGVAAGEYLRPADCATCVPAHVALLSSPNQLQYVPNDNATEVTILFDRSVFASTQPVWLFNAFTTRSKTGAAIDSMGGNCATCFTSPQLPVSSTFQKTIFANANAGANDPAANIVSIEFSNAR